MRQLVYAHRGASGYAPENTLEAFALAIRQGADGVELDVHLSSEGEIVVIHDESIDRVSNGRGLVCEMILEELKRYHYGASMPGFESAAIPTLREVLELVRPTQLGVNIELKNSIIDYPFLEKLCLDLVRQMRMEEQVMYSSFNHHSMARMKAISPAARCGLLYSSIMVRPWDYAKGLGMDALHPHMSELLVPGECAQAHALGIAVNTWTVNETEHIRRVLEAGADMVITNYPDRALAVLREGE